MCGTYGMYVVHVAHMWYMWHICGACGTCVGTYRDLAENHKGKVPLGRPFFMNLGVL
jgi:hypothetical protein